MRARPVSRAAGMLELAEGHPVLKCDELMRLERRRRRDVIDIAEATALAARGDDPGDGRRVERGQAEEILG